MQATHIANPVRVNAATILEVLFDDTKSAVMLHLDSGRLFEADGAMCARYKPTVGDYLVTQEDGYEYLNPKDVFERKYSPITDSPSTAGVPALDQTAAAALPTLSNSEQQRLDHVRVTALSYAHANLTLGAVEAREFIKAAQLMESYLLGIELPPAQPDAAKATPAVADDRPLYQQRVSSETAELGMKIHNLSLFIASGRPFDQLDVAERGRLNAQLEYMKSYYAILEQRICAWSEQSE